MKKIYLLLILIATVSICGCNKEVKKNDLNNEKKNDLKEYGFKGKVKYVEEKTYYVMKKFGEAQKDKLKEYRLISFKKDGYILNETSSYGIKKFKYDSNGNKIEASLHNSSGSLDWKTKYKYNSKRNKIEANFYNSDGILEGKSKYKYDSKINIIEENHYYSDGTLYLKTIYKYDLKGNKVESCNYSFDGSLDMKETYKYVYDSKENWIKKIVKDENGGAKEITERKIVYYGDKDENNYPQWDTHPLQE